MTPDNPLEHKALVLLGEGHNQEAVANALGVTAGRVSQWMARPEFASEVAKLRFSQLSAGIERDALIDQLEDKLLAKLNKMVPLLNDPFKVARIWKDVNGAKRSRLTSGASGANITQQTIVQLQIPEALVRKYKSNAEAQVIEIDDKPFLTAPTNKLEHILNESATKEGSPALTASESNETVDVKFAKPKSGISAEDL